MCSLQYGGSDFKLSVQFAKKKAVKMQRLFKSHGCLQCFDEMTATASQDRGRQNNLLGTSRSYSRLINADPIAPAVRNLSARAASDDVPRLFFAAQTESSPTAAIEFTRC